MTLDETDVTAPLIDRIKPTARIVDQPTQDNYDTERITLLDNESNTIATGSYYAGDVEFRIELTDSGSSQYAGNPITRWQNYAGISGLRSYSLEITRIEDHLGNPVNDTIENSTNTIPEEMARRKDATLDTVASKHTFQWKGEIRKTGLYRMTLQVGDYAGNILNEANNDQNVVYFHVVPAMTPLDDCPPGQYCRPPCLAEICIPTLPQSEVNDIKAQCEVNPQDPSCTRSDLGVVTLVHPEEHALFADANVLYKTTLTFYDRYYNVMDHKNLLSITQTGETIPLDRVASSPERSIVTQVNDSGTTGNFITYPTTPPRFGTTDGSGSVAIQSFSYTPGKFTVHYTGKICLWDRHGTPECQSNTGYDAHDRERYPDGHSITKEFYHIFTGAIALDPDVLGIQLGSHNDIALQYTSTMDDPLHRTFKVTNFMESLRTIDSTATGTTDDKFTLTHTGTYESSVVRFFINTVRIPNNKSNFTPEQVRFEDQFSTGSTTDLGIRTDPITTITLTSIDNVPKTARYYIAPERDYYGSGIIYTQ